MAKPNYSYEKRQRELAKKKKKEEKLQEKAARKGSGGGGATPTGDPGLPGEEQGTEVQGTEADRTAG